MIPRCPTCGRVVTRARTVGSVPPWRCTTHGPVGPRWTLATTVQSRQSKAEKLAARRARKAVTP